MHFIIDPIIRIIDKQDGVRLLWSLLKSPNPEVSAIINVVLL